MPPDQYFSVVVQLTRGCSWNRCTFCNFYADQAFGVMEETAFVQHLEAVSALLGRGAALRPTLFLGGGNALMLSNRRLLALLRRARQVFGDRPAAGFVDVAAGAKKSLADWQALRAEGVERVYLGLETGHDPLLAWLGKPGSRAESLKLAHTLRAAGLSVNPIVMVGVGGEAYAADHEAQTAELLRELPLEAGDLAYLSPFVPHPGSEYTRRAEAAGLRPLTQEALDAQYQALATAARRPGVRAARYDIGEFLY
ncbi:radical SAM protein [Deinococcus lacus]|uniref:Radical SAM protein n=1 Tax=Deinococcus lacus TaxID=392561 RepID=A0ABW1YEE1_9DEIO